jgi:hypothetical protein
LGLKVNRKLIRSASGLATCWERVSRTFCWARAEDEIVCNRKVNMTIILLNSLVFIIQIFAPIFSKYLREFSVPVGFFHWNG